MGLSGLATLTKCLTNIHNIVIRLLPAINTINVFACYLIPNIKTGCKQSWKQLLFVLWTFWQDLTTRLHFQTQRFQMQSSRTVHYASVSFTTHRRPHFGTTHTYFQHCVTHSNTVNVHTHTHTCWPSSQLQRAEPLKQISSMSAINTWLWWGHVTEKSTLKGRVRHFRCYSCFLVLPRIRWQHSCMSSSVLTSETTTWQNNLHLLVFPELFHGLSDSLVIWSCVKI